MSDRRALLWPYSVTAALLTVPAVWIALFVLVALARKFIGWPEPDLSTVVTWAILLAGVMPVALVVLDFMSAKGAIVEVRGVKVDFSRVAPVPVPAMWLPDNVGIPGNVVPDSSPMQIVDALQTAKANDVAVVDLHGGNAWWVTRLLALSAGAARAGRPSAIVFVGREGSVDSRFLGYAPPEVIVRVIGDAEATYRMAYDESKLIALQVQLLARHPPIGLNADPIVQRYLMDPHYAELGDAMLEQILMDQLVGIEHQGQPGPGIYPDYPRAPNQPDRLTLMRLRELLAPELLQDTIELQRDPEPQVEQFLRLDVPYIALTRNGVYESLVRREAIESLVLRQLLGQTTASASS